MRVECSRFRMMTSIYQSSTPGLHLSEASASWLPRILSSLAFHIVGDLPRVILEKKLTNGHKNGKMPGQICRSYPKVFVLELQNSSGLTNILILRSNHGFVDFTWVWITLSSCFPHQDFSLRCPTARECPMCRGVPGCARGCPDVPECARVPGHLQETFCYDGPDNPFELFLSARIQYL